MNATKFSRRRFCLASASSLGLGLGPAWGQSYPSRPITIVVPAGPGSITDSVSRILASSMNQRLGWTMVVDNKPGGNFVIGTRQVTTRPADGYTILLAFASLTVLPHSIANLPFDLVKDFVPIARTATSPTLIFSTPDAPFKTIEALVSYARARPGELSYGSAGYGTYHHLTGELFMQLNKLQLRNIPYKDANFAPDVVSGTIPLGINSVAAVAPLLKSGQLRGLAILGKSRTAAFPDIPTVAEAGFSPMDQDTWLGWMVRKDTPQEAVDVLRREVEVTLRLPAVQTALENIGAKAVVDEPPEEFAKLLKTQIDTWGTVIREANIKFN